MGFYGCKIGVLMDWPFGKRLQKTMGRSTMVLMGKLTISTAPFSMAMLNDERVDTILKRMNS